MDQTTKAFLTLTTPDDLAGFFGLPLRTINYVLYTLPPDSRYTTFTIPKKNGEERSISKPTSCLLRAQKTISLVLSEIYRRPKAVNGFVCGRSIVDNARPHIKNRMVFNVDLKDFFPSINVHRIRGIFESILRSPDRRVVTLLADICSYEGKLPQGSPASPVIANMACRRLDFDLINLARRHRCYYTRYADDITFSKKSGDFPNVIGYMDQETNRSIVGSDLLNLIKGNGFDVNHSKVRLQNRAIRQSVTGLTVNAKVNVNRRYVRQVRSMIYAWKRWGLEKAENEYFSMYCSDKRKDPNLCSFRDIVRGKLEFIRMVKGPEDEVFLNLRSKYAEVDGDYMQKLIAEQKSLESRDFFISHASEDKEWVRKLVEELVRKNCSVWFDEYELRVGDSLVGKINEGISNSSYGVVVLSQAFFKKKWTLMELDTFISYMGPGKKVLPIWLDIDQQFLEQASPLMIRIVAIRAFETTIANIANQLMSVLEG